MSELLHFSEHTLQEVALLFMVVVYTLRIRWFLRFKAGKELQAPTGSPGTTKAKGIIYSWAIIANPAAMESIRSKLFLYLQFVIFHLGVTAAIGLSFVIPYAPHLLESKSIVAVLQAVIGAAFLIGCYRFLRRVVSRYMRAISTPDDYFSLILLTIWFLFATLSTPNNIEKGETILIIYFILTAFFLIYVPFSKISHYLYYPFTRYYFGKSMGYRGVYPLQRNTSKGDRQDAILNSKTV